MHWFSYCIHIHGDVVFLYSIFLTCRGRLSIKGIIPKVTNRRLVKMKALMALVSFWIFLSLFGGSDWLKRTNVKCQRAVPAKDEVWMLQRWHSAVVTKTGFRPSSITVSSRIGSFQGRYRQQPMTLSMFHYSLNLKRCQ